VAGERHVFRRITAAVLPSDDVLHMKRNGDLMVAMKKAVFTTMIRPLNDEPAQGGSHQAAR
jgi:hypothetical protein